MDKLTINKKQTKLKYEQDFNLMWSLDVSLSAIIYPLLERFRDQAGPLSLCGALSEKQWINTLNKMIWSHKYIVYDMTDDKELREKLKSELNINNDSDFLVLEDKANKGIKLFAKYYRGLWY